MNGVPAGALRHRLILEERAKVDDGGGGFTESWNTVTTLWGVVRPLRGDEQLVAGRLAGNVSHLITLRYRDGVVPEMRFRQGERVFEIHAVIDPDERKCWLRCQCEERGL
ncbi:Phage head-tail joining protein [Methyloligella halotolerans]|uniref:Phage head-tail joining protein n=1 Tax=Methyloligella halotolerans TaxID=1177755 RepID=A0A1E2RXQ9_9HYPH|nr:phage head closure protein [Methyloligella halotolerans]ODA66839.1 Phage head-tail joining protein [Methyloligella halotolerans]